MNKIYKINDEKFKTVYVSINYLIDATKEEISRLSVVSSLLGKCNKKYKTQKDVEKYLLELYSASFDINVQKIGDLYNVEFKIEFVNKEFLNNKKDVFLKCLEFLHDIIYNPEIIEGKFKNEIFEREKQTILERILQRKDDKIYYGLVKMEEMMFENEVAGTYIYGDEDVVRNTTNEELVKSYYNLLNNSSIQVLVTGNISSYVNIEDMFDKVFGNKIKSKLEVKDLIVDKNTDTSKIEKVRTTTEEIDFNQSVLSLGYKIISKNPDDYYRLTLYNAILGGTPSSKLFQNVREKNSLAYITVSRYFRFKNIIVVTCAISRNNYAKSLEVISKQIEDIKNGNITDEEFESAKQSILFNLANWKDSKTSIAKIYYSNLLDFKDSNLTIEKMKEKFLKLKKEDIIDIANKIYLKEIVFLGGNSDV